MSRAGDLRNITATGTASEDNYVLTYDDASKKVSLEAAAGGDVVDDTTPQLGGNLDVNGKSIVSTGMAEIDITSDGVLDLNANNGNVDITSIGGSVFLAGDTGDMKFTNTYNGVFQFKDTANNSNNGPIIELFRDPPSGTMDGYNIGTIDFVATNTSNTTPHVYARMYVEADDGSNNTEDGSIRFRMSSSGTEAFNRSDTMILKHELVSINGKVGIGSSTISPSDYYAKDLVVGAADEGGITIVNGTTEQGYLMFADGTGGSPDARFRGYIGYDHNIEHMQMTSGGILKFLVNNTTQAMTVDTSGRLTVGSIGTDTTLSGGQPALQVTGSGFNGYMAAVRRDTSQYSSGIILAKSRSSTADNFTALADNDQIGGIIFIGDDGTDLDTYGATIQAEVNGTPAVNNMPTDLIFSTNPGTNTVTERMRILKGGNVGIGDTNPGDLLTVSKTASDHTSAAISIQNTQSGGYGGRLNFVSTRGSTQVIAAYIGTDGMENWSDVANTSSNLKFYTVNDGTLAERMRIRSNGNVGIGTTSPAEPLDVQGADSGIIVRSAVANRPHIKLINGTTNMLQLSANGTYGAIGDGTDANRYMSFKDGKVGINTTSANFNLDVNGGMRVMNAGNDAYGQLYIQATGTGDAQIAFVTTANGRSIYVDQNDGNKMRFSTGWGKGVAYKEMVIDNDANLICGGGTKEGRGITLYGSGGNGFYSVTTGTSFYCITNHNLSSSTGTISTFYNDSTYCGGITISSTNQTNYQSGSDYRLKENIVDMADGATAILKQLRPRTFNFKSDPSNTIDGFIAHEVEGIVDNAVSGTKDEVYDEAGADDNPNVNVGDPKYQGIDPGKMVPLLVKTIQELEARITQLESE